MASDYEQEFVVKVGSKGEIFPPKQIREQLEFTQGQPLIIRVEGDTLIIRKLHSAEEILQKKPKIKISHHAMKKMRSELNSAFEER